LGRFPIDVDLNQALEITRSGTELKPEVLQAGLVVLVRKAKRNLLPTL
jgi:hypothetical protein